MTDVARLAGVSTSTVSRALRQPDIVSPAVRARIDEAIERLSYRRNMMAGALASSRSLMIVVIVPSIINSFFAATIEALEEGLAGSGYHLMLGNSGYSVEREEHLVTSLLSWAPAAMVLTGRRHSRGTIRSLIEAGIPIVEMWEMSDQPIDTVVGFSQRGTGERAARHFAERGARRLGFVGAALDRDYRAADRHAGFVEAALQAGCEEPAAIRLPERASGTAGAEGLARLMAAYPEVDAVLFSNDALALGGLFEAQRKGWAVPGRLKVCGFGDLEFAAATQPALTTIRPPRREIGARIAEILRSRLTLIPQNGPRFAGEDDAEAKSPKQRAGPSGAFDLGFELVVRGSS